MNPTLVDRGMRYWRLKPDARLRPQVLCYFFVESVPRHRYTALAEPAIEELLFPDGYSEIVFTLATGYERWPVGEEGRNAIMGHSYLIGGRSHSVSTRTLGTLRLAGVKLDPRLLRALLGIPLTELRDCILTLPDLGRRSLLELEDAVANARSAVEVAAILDGFFLDAMRDTRADEPLTGALLRRIHDSRGALSIMSWAREQRIDARSLERRFCAWMGMTPKQYARIVRFKHAYHRLISSGARRGTLGAHLEGYYDQSHFIREFRYFTGTSPTARIEGRMRQGTTVTDHLLEGELALGGLG